MNIFNFLQSIKIKKIFNKIYIYLLIILCFIFQFFNILIISFIIKYKKILIKNNIKYN